MAKYALTTEGRQVPPDEILEALSDGPKDLTGLLEETGLQAQEILGKLSIYMRNGYVRQEIARPEAPSDIHHDMSDYLVGKRTPNWDETLR